MADNFKFEKAIGQHLSAPDIVHNEVSLFIG
jgi:hypothetical protein